MGTGSGYSSPAFCKAQPLQGLHGTERTLQLLGRAPPAPASPPPDLCPCRVGGRNGHPKSLERPGCPGQGERQGPQEPPLQCLRARGLTQAGVQPRGGASGSGSRDASPSLHTVPCWRGPSAVGCFYPGPHSLPSAWTRVDRLPCLNRSTGTEGHRSWHGGGLPGPRPDSHPLSGGQGLAIDRRLVLRRAQGFPLPHRSAGWSREEAACSPRASPSPEPWKPVRADRPRSPCPPVSTHTCPSLSLQSWSPRPAGPPPLPTPARPGSLCGVPRQQADMSGPVHAAPRPGPALLGQQAPSPESCREGLSDGRASASPGRGQCTRTRLSPRPPVHTCATPPCRCILALHAHVRVHVATGPPFQVPGPGWAGGPQWGGGCGHIRDGASPGRAPVCPGPAPRRGGGRPRPGARVRVRSTCRSPALRRAVGPIAVPPLPAVGVELRVTV